jgi:hypothetical protein
MPLASSHSRWNSNHQVLQHLCLTWSTTVFTWSTRSTPSSHVILLVDILKCQPPRSVLRPSWSHDPSLTPVLHRSQSIGTTRLYLTFSMAVDCMCAPHLHTNTAKRHVAHIHTHTMVSLQTQLKPIISRQSLITNSTQEGTYQPCVRT